MILTQAAISMRYLLQLPARQPWLPRLLPEPLPVGLPEPACIQQLYINTKVAVGDCPCLYWLDKPAGQTCSWFTASQHSLMVAASAVSAHREVTTEVTHQAAAKACCLL